MRATHMFCRDKQHRPLSKMYGQNSGYGTGPRRQSSNSGSQSRYPHGSDFSTGRMEDQQDQLQDSDQQFNNPTQEPTPPVPQEPQYNGSFVVIPPNQAKRNKLLTMANKEEEEYNNYVESRRSVPIQLTPKKLGGDTSVTKARAQQQITQSQSKYQKQFKRDEYKRRQREEEEAEIQKKKDIQRKKAEKLEEKRHLEEIERRERWHTHRAMKNSEFLDQLSQPANSSSYNSYERTPSAWERSPSGKEQDWNNYTDQDEESMLQLALKESMKTKMEEDQKRQTLKTQQPYQAKSASDEEEQDWSPCNPGMKEYTASQQFYKQLREEEEERKWQQMEEEHCRKASKQSYRSYKQQQKEEEERKLQEMKEEQRRKSEMLEVKKAEEEKEGKLSQQEERRRVNNAFLDKLQRLSTKKEEYSGESNTWA
ncbi:epithelial-stromal interaction protein 1 isoform X2 [Rana temporaria]|uniref:epithelial-stromal interaction protein 1 isoform X2 n=1 Tax=Rana temporaria TaxID=8407 RepID=UPI001AACFDEA|nr:epithelial-stromal interaction protein 1 isoform X2 [Rana temporaria]